MTPRALGIIGFEADHIKVEGLGNHRPMMSISFMGRYRLVDFPISNFTNSNIDDIHVYVKEKPRSVFEHVGTGRHYNINSKQGRLRVMYGEQEISSSIYNTDVRAYLQNEAFIWENKSEYVIVAPTHFIYTQDFDKVLDKHIESNKDITVLYHSCKNAKEDFLGLTTLNLDREKNITGFEVNRGQAKQRNISLETYVMKKTVFFDLLREADYRSRIYWLKEIIEEAVHKYSMRGYPVMGTVLGITDLQSYYDVSMRMLDKEKPRLITRSWPIYTKTNDSPPAIYDVTADVESSSIANGTVIKGKVSNSIIGRNVIIEKGAIVENSIILPSSYIGRGVHVRGAVVDRHVCIEKTKMIDGSRDNLIYINRHDKI